MNENNTTEKQTEIVSEPVSNPSAKTNLLIVIVAFFLAVLVVWDGERTRDAISQINTAPPAPTASREDNQRIYGNPEAEITIVEFSDYECAYCLLHHPTLKQIVDESGGKVNWEYRHLPLSFHPNALPSALAAECVGDIAGNDAFWKFSDALFDNQQDLSTTLYEDEAQKLGVKPLELASCMEDEQILARIQTDARVAQKFGGNGTPFNVIMYADGSNQSVSGAVPYVQFKQLIQ